MIFNLGGGGVTNANQLNYDNSKSGLESTDVQGALDEVTERLADGNVKFQITADGKLQYSVYTE